MTDRFDRRQLLALLLIGVGVLWLLSSIGFVPGRFIGTLLWYWPILAIAFGLDLLIEERLVFGLPYVAVAVILLLLLALVAPAGGARGLAERTFSEPLAGAERATVRLDLGNAPTTVGGLDDDATLFRAIVVDSGDVAFEAGGRGEKTVRLSRRSRRPGPPGAQSSWTVGVNRKVPLSLDVDVGSGPVTLDLRELELEELVLDGSSGAASVSLPGREAAGGRPYQVALDIGSGSTRVTIADGARLALKADGGSGAASFELGRDVAAELTLEVGSGSVVIDVPESAPVQLEVRDDGSGQLTVPAFLQRVSGSGERGVWQTPGFRSGGGVVVVVESAGSGSITVR